MAKTLTLALALIMCTTGALSQQKVACPAFCTCQYSGSTQLSLDVTCEDVTFVVLPLLPRSVNNLVITSSPMFSTIPSNLFLYFNFKDLKTLGLKSNDIKEVQAGAFTGLPSLEKLDLSQNKIMKLDSSVFLRMDNLKVLNINNNLLTSVPDLTKLKSLEVLLLNYNFISGIPCASFQSVSALTTLYMNHNKLTHLGSCMFDGLHHLTELGMNNNLISRIQTPTFGQVQKITLLGLSGNKLTLASFNNLVFAPMKDNLKRLTLADNEFDKVPTVYFVLLSKLQHLDLSGNSIQTIAKEAFMGLESLQDLYLDSIDSLTSVESGAFEGLVNLQTLAMEGNKQLTDFSVDAFGTDRISSDLEDLFLDNCRLTTFSTSFMDKLNSFPNMRIVNIQDNPIHCDCSTRNIQNAISSGAVWASTWTTKHIPKCTSPTEFKGKAINDIITANLICDSPNNAPVKAKNNDLSVSKNTFAELKPIEKDEIHEPEVTTQSLDQGKGASVSSSGFSISTLVIALSCLVVLSLAITAIAHIRRNRKRKRGISTEEYQTLLDERIYAASTSKTYGSQTC